MLRMSMSIPIGPSVYPGHADPADYTAVTDRAKRRLQDLHGPDTIQHRAGAIAAGQLPHPLGRRPGAVLGRDLGGAELLAEVGTGLWRRLAYRLLSPHRVRRRQGSVDQLLSVVLATA